MHTSQHGAMTIHRPLLHSMPKKYDLVLKVVLKCRDAYFESIGVVSLIAQVLKWREFLLGKWSG